MAKRTRQRSFPIGRHHLWGVAFLGVFCARLAFAQSISNPDVSALQNSASKLRLEVVPTEGGAEIVTILGRVESPGDRTEVLEIPLISVLRDTLGSDDPEVHRWRYVWVHTYTKPTRKQRSAAGVPFLYNRLGNKQGAEIRVLPPLLDLSFDSSSVGRRLYRILIQNLFFDSRAALVRSPAFAYIRNQREFRKAHLTRALTILSVCGEADSEQHFVSKTELDQLQARVSLSAKMLAGWLDETQVERFYQKETARIKQVRSRNWELLRQRSEEEGLYFDPLQLPGGTATHALLWVAREDLIRPTHPRFDGRFLSIASPWQDQRLLNWKGHVERRYLDVESRLVTPDPAQGKVVELIPLALYGLDYPKIPVLLVDFRDPLNAKRRELSERLVHDVANNVLSLSPFGNLYYGGGLAAVDFITHRRGADISQQSRLTAYSQLKLLLLLDSTLDPEVRGDISRRLERLTLNPLENDVEAESRLARAQYQALLDYARSPDGLRTRLERDRRRERTQEVHGSIGKTFLQIANILSFGIYTHREKAHPELQALLDNQRRTDHYLHFFRKVTESSPRPEVNWDTDVIRRRLLYLAENRGTSRNRVMRLATQLLALSKDESIRQLCLEALGPTASRRARTELYRIARNQTLDSRWCQRSAEYLELAAPPAPAETTAPQPTAAEIGGNQ